MRAPLALTLLVAALATGCGGLIPDPQPGDACTAAAGCADPTTALLCEEGKLRAIPCRGVDGCTTTSSQLSCSIVAYEGDACHAENEDRAQCDLEAADRALKCTAGTWVGQECKRCEVRSAQVMCGV